MNVKEELTRGLTSKPKYIPSWFRFDKTGSQLYDMCTQANPHHYLHRAETDILKRHVFEMVGQVPNCRVIVDLGSGNSVKTRYFIDALLQKHGTLTYIPVDISKEFVSEVCESLKDIYGDVLKVYPIFEDFDRAIHSLGSMKETKMIVWFGSLQCTGGRDVQIGKLQSLSRNMNATDRLFVSLDITNDEETILNAYSDTAGYLDQVHNHSVWRLNREYGSNININKFKLIGTFDPSSNPNEVSKFKRRLRSIGQQTIVIAGLDLTIHFEDGEFLNLYQNDGNSCTYTLDQIETLMSSGTQSIVKKWISPDHHVVFCCLAKL